MMYSQIIEKTPSIYFKFDDQSHRNFSKSSFALDYSISNQKQLLSNNRFSRLKNNNNTTIKQQFNLNSHQLSPLSNLNKIHHEEPTTHQLQQDQFLPLHPSQKPTSTKKLNKLKTEDFFDEFDKKYSFIFEQDDICTHEFIPEAEYQGESKITRGFLDFQEFQVEQTMKLIQIDSKKKIKKNYSINSPEDIDSSNLISFTQTNQNIFSSQITASVNNEKTQNKMKNPELSNETSVEFSTDNQNCIKNQDSQFEEIISFGPHHKSNSKVRKYKASNTRHFITKDFENNSSLLEKTRPIIEPKRRVPFKNIENLIQKCAKDQTRSQTRKKPIINTDMLISTINKTEKNQVKQTNGAWSNPINNKKSSSLECTFTYDNMFKTNAFRQTLKSTTLQNWKKKYHKKIGPMGDKKTVYKKNRGTNIFENLFIRA